MKIQTKKEEILTKEQQTFDLQMPAVLYKENYNSKTGTWSVAWMSPNLKKSTGFGYADFQNDNSFWAKRLHPDDKKLALKKFDGLRKGKSDSMEITCRWLHKDGTYHWFIDCATLIRDSKNKPSEIIGSLVDISVHAKANTVIEENEEHYKKIVELSPHALFVHNEGIFRFLNVPAIKLFGGKSEDDIVGKPILDFIHPDYREQKMQRMKNLFEHSKSLPPIDYKIITLQGAVKEVEIASTLFTFEGKPSAQEFVIDVTKLKKVEDIYRAHADELEHLNKILMKREGEQSARGEKICTASFDSDSDTLLIGKFPVKIKKFSKQYYMLQIIFKDLESMEKDWQFSEISEYMDMEALFDWKRLYNIADAIRKNIAIETGIKDFFILTTQSIKINPLYLGK